MARIFRQKYTAKDGNGRRVGRQSRKWYVEYVDADRIRRRVPGFTDKPATQQLASDLEKQAAREASGLVDKFAEHRKRALSEHVDDWREALVAKGTSQKHANLLSGRVGRVLDGCRFTYWPDLSASRVQTYVAALRTDTEDKRGISAQTFNFYLQAIKQFCRWMVKDRRATDSPVAHLDALNVATDRRHDRRALTPDELQRLLNTARHGPDRCRMPGPDRSRLYQLAVETGLRAGELRSLAWGSFNLKSQSPTVTVNAAYSKRRRDDTLPLKGSTAAMLARWRDSLGPMGSETLIFAAMPQKHAVVKMLRGDLADAGIEYRDAAGTVADFHCLRHTFITNLARSGVHPRVAQQLARHSTITLTMDRYTHTVVGELSEALDGLPDLSSDGPVPDRKRATGTCDIAPKFLPLSLPISLPTPAASETPRRASDCIQPGNATGSSRHENPEKTGAKRTSVHAAASDCNRRRRDSNPRDSCEPNGFQDRRLQPLGHSSTTPVSR